MVTTVADTAYSFLLPFVSKLRTDGWTVDLLAAPITNPEIGRLLNKEFSSVHTISWSRSPKSLLQYAKLSAQIRRVAQSGSYSVVHTHTPIASMITRLALRTMSIRPKIIYTAHGFHFLKAQLNGGLRSRAAYHLYRGIESRLFSYTDVLVTINSEDEQAAQSFVRIGQTTPQAAGSTAGRSTYEQRIMRIDGVGVQLPTNQPIHPDSDSFTIGMIAEFNSNKNHELLLNALGLLKSDGLLDSRSVRVLFAGQGVLMAHLKTMVHQLGLDTHVQFLGQLPAHEIPALASRCDLGVLVSKREGLPRSLMEFIAAGSCVAGVTTRGIIDVVVTPEALAEPKPAAVASLLRKLITDDTLRQNLARRQFEHAKQHYQIDHIVDQYIAVYESLNHV